jgi:hypothetical protein
MKLIKLDRRHHGHSKWTHAIQFTRREAHIKHMGYLPYIKAFREMYGEDRTYEPGSFFWKQNPNWTWDQARSRIYLNDPSVLTFIELKLV